MTQPVVIVVMGSASDWPIMQSAAEMLDRFQVPYEVTISGVPVATVAIGTAGAANAGVLAAQIVALTQPEVSESLRSYKSELASGVEKAAQTLQAQLAESTA